jgi:hypothetical protein
VPRAIAQDDVAAPLPLPYEGQGPGRIVLGCGHVAVMMISRRHGVPGGQKRGYSGYTDPYTFDGKQLVPVDAAPDPGRIGTKQAWGMFVDFDNDVVTGSEERLSAQETKPAPLSGWPPA